MPVLRFATILILLLPFAPVAKPAQQTVAQKIADDAHLIDINTATPRQLKTLPGINDVLAVRIIAGRPYTSKIQLLRRGVLSSEEYKVIVGKVIAHAPKAAN